MTVCLNCGKSINVVGRTCPYCNSPIEIGSVTSKEKIKMNNDYDHSSNLLFALSLIIPIFGYIFYYLNKETQEIKSKSAMFGALIGTIFYLAIISVVIIIKLNR